MIGLPILHLTFHLESSAGRTIAPSQLRGTSRRRRQDIPHGVRTVCGRCADGTAVLTHLNLVRHSVVGWESAEAARLLAAPVDAL